jgi:WD40 repeat protein
LGLAEASPVGKGDDWKSVKLEGMVGIGVSGAFSGGAKHALVATLDGGVGLWDVATGGKLGVAHAHEGGATSVAFLPDGERAVSVGMDRVLRLWDLRPALRRSGALVEVRPPAGPAWPLEAVAVSPDGKHAALGCEDGSVHFLGLARPGPTPGADWRPGPSLEEARIEGPGGGASSVAFTRNGAHVLAGGAEGSVLSWRVGEVLGGGAVATVGSFSAHRGTVRALAVSPDGTRVLTAGSDAAARLWDAAAICEGTTFIEQLVSLTGNMGDVLSVAFMPEGRVGFTAGTEGGLRTWDLSSGERLLRFDADAGEVRAALAPDGLWALAGRGDDRTVTLWRFAIDSPRVLGTHASPVRGVAITPDGARAVSIGLTGDVKVWDTAHGVELDAFSLGSGDELLALAIVPDGRSFVIATARGVVLQLELRS